MFKKKLSGRFIYIIEKDFQLRQLTQYFSIEELRYVFGDDIINHPYNFEEIENDVWSIHLVVKTTHLDKFVGYIRIISVKDIVEIHGGGINNTFFDKMALTEAWLLIINWCFQYFKTDSIFTSCMIDNNKAYKFITGTGFKETSRNLNENRISFILTFDEFQYYNLACSIK